MIIRAVTLESPDPGAAAAFYAERFGFPTRVARDASGDGERHGVVFGRSVLWFRPGETGVAYHVAMNVAEHRFDDTLAWMCECVDVLADDRDPPYLFDSWNAHSAYFFDRDGNIIEFIARHALTSTYSGPSGPALIESVSEVGLPVGDVGPSIEWLCERLNLARWSVWGDRFGAIGDEEGLLIVVPTGRLWYPTTVPADARPVVIEAERATVGVVQVANHPYEVRFVRSPSESGQGASC